MSAAARLPVTLGVREVYLKCWTALVYRAVTIPPLIPPLALRTMRERYALVIASFCVSVKISLVSVKFPLIPHKDAPTRQSFTILEFRNKVIVSRTNSEIDLNYKFAKIRKWMKIMWSQKSKSSKIERKRIFSICIRQNWWLYNYISHYVPFKRKGVSKTRFLIFFRLRNCVFLSVSNWIISPRITDVRRIIPFNENVV